MTFLPLVQVRNVAAAGARAALVSNNDTTGFFRILSDSSSSSTSIPSGSLPLSTARPLYNALAAGTPLSAQILSYTLPAGMLSPLHTLAYPSRCP